MNDNNINNDNQNNGTEPIRQFIPTAIVEEKPTNEQEFVNPVVSASAPQFTQVAPRKPEENNTPQYGQTTIANQLEKSNIEAEPYETTVVKIDVGENVNPAGLPTPDELFEEDIPDDEILNLDGKQYVLVAEVNYKNANYDYLYCLTDEATTIMKETMENDELTLTPVQDEKELDDLIYEFSKLFNE